MRDNRLSGVREGGSVRTLSVVVPVYNEATVLPKTVPALLNGLPSSAELVYVCNGCKDDSRRILERLLQGRGEILELETASKAAAIRLGESWVSSFPRFYVDADVVISGREVEELAAWLGKFDMVSPRIRFDLSGVSRLMRHVHETWLSLPYARHGAFQYVIGVSEGGRAKWGVMPDVICDDVYMASRLPSFRRKIVQAVAVTVFPPRSLSSFVAVGVRWEAGAAQLQKLGVKTGTSGSQTAALARRATNPRQLAGAAAYCACRILSKLAFKSGMVKTAWFRDESSRTYL